MKTLYEHNISTGKTNPVYTGAIETLENLKATLEAEELRKRVDGKQIFKYYIK